MGRSNTKRKKLNVRLMRYEDRFRGLIMHDEQIWFPKPVAEQRRRKLRKAIKTKDFSHLHALLKT